MKDVLGGAERMTIVLCAALRPLGCQAEIGGVCTSQAEATRADDAMTDVHS